MAIAELYVKNDMIEEAVELLVSVPAEVRSSESIAALSEEFSRKYGFINLSVSDKSHSNKAISGVTVTFEGAGHTFSTTTNENGDVYQHLPVGDYTVIVSKDNFELKRWNESISSGSLWMGTSVNYNDDVSVLMKIDAYVKQGEEYLEKEDYQEAESAFTSALELDPERCAVYLKRAELYVKWAESFGDGRSKELSDEMLALYQKALQDYRTALDLGDHEALYKDGYCDVYDIMADLYERIGDEEGYWEIIGEGKGG